MNNKTIFSELKFTPIKEESLIISKPNINKIAELFDNIFKTTGTTQQFFITKALEAEALAISTAEDSSLSPSEASKINITEEQSLRILKYQKSKAPLEKKYEMLEYENIKSISNQSTGIGFEHLNLEILNQLHHDLTIGLDEYASQLDISKYHPGQFRANDTVKVGKFPPYEPPTHKKIKKLLNELFAYYQTKKQIHLVDIIEFGLLLYAIHPFQNGNKRVVRIIESALLDFYGYSAKKTISLGRTYAAHKDGFNHFLLYALNHRNTTAFVNFTLRCYTDDGKRTMADITVDDTENKLGKRILDSANEKKQKQYKTAFLLFKKHAFLKNSKFTELMIEAGYTHSISQGILKVMIKEDILNKLSNGNYILAEFRQFVKLADFIDQHTKK